MGLYIAPKTCFGVIFEVKEIRAIWIRVFGSLCALLGWYYYGASKSDGSMATEMLKESI